jgi:hypothetical protein
LTRFVRQAAPVVAVIAWFLYLIRRAVYEYFNVDDMTNLVIPFIQGYENLVKGSVLFWTGVIRPLGGLFYLVTYQFAGFHPRPFRYAAIAFLVLNLVLLYVVLRRLNDSVWFAAFALTIACFNGSMSDMYMSTGTVYDTLGLTFTLLALLCVMRDQPRWMLAALCTIAAVDSKEMGAAIPALILAYELIVRVKPRFAAVISTGVVALVFTVSRIAFKNPLSDHRAYQLTITWPRFVETTSVYLNDVAFNAHMSGWLALAVLFGALALAALLRNRLMLFGWCFYVCALLPMTFATPRAGYAVYIPYAGVAIYFAAFFTLRPLTRFTTGLGVGFLGLIAALQYSQARQGLPPAGGEGSVKLVGVGIGKLVPSMPKGASLLLINDPFGPDEEELPHSTLRLRYRDPNLHTTKLTWKLAPGKIPYPPGPFDHVFLFREDSVMELAKEAGEVPVPEFTTMGSPASDISIVKDIAGRYGAADRWVNQDPEMLFRVPLKPAHFEMAYSVPEVILHQTKTLDLDAWIADQPAPAIHLSEAKDFLYTAPIPANVKPGETVVVRFHVRNPYVSPGDGTKLAFLIKSAGFVLN